MTYIFRDESKTLSGDPTRLCRQSWSVCRGAFCWASLLPPRLDGIVSDRGHRAMVGIWHSFFLDVGRCRRLCRGYTICWSFVLHLQLFFILHCSRSHGWYCFLRVMKYSKEHKASHSVLVRQNIIFFKKHMHGFTWRNNFGFDFA